MKMLVQKKIVQARQLSFSGFYPEMILTAFSMAACEDRINPGISFLPCYQIQCMIGRSGPFVIAV
jgi:hypothetical protein